MPSDANLKDNLRAARGFTDSAVGEFIDQFKRTIDFAKPDESDTGSGREDDVPSRESEDHMSAMPASPASERKAPSPSLPNDSRHRQVQLPPLGPDWTTLYVPYPLDEAEWDHMIAVLNMMKPSLVPSRKPEPQPANQGEPEPVTS